MSDIANSKFCRNCGTQVSRSDEFCPCCGEVITSKIFCKECGAANAQGQAFCENCGASLINASFTSSKETGANDDGQTGLSNQEEWIASALKNEIPTNSQKSKKHQTKWQCSQCGAMNTERDNFCGNCGSMKSHKEASKKQSESIPTSEPGLHEKESGTDSGTSSSKIKQIGIIFGIVACLVFAFFAIWKAGLIPGWQVRDTDEHTEPVSLQIPDHTPNQGDTPKELVTSALPIEEPEDNTPQEPVECLHENVRKEEGQWEWESAASPTICRGGTRIVKTFCIDCGDLLSEETQYMGDIEHNFDGEGVCVDCGYQKTDSEYLLPDSSRRYLAEEDLAHLTHEELCFARNEIYARHGWIFSTKAIAEYFQSKSWYEGTTLPQSFNSSVLNQYETYNISLISDYEAAHFGGSYY